MNFPSILKKRKPDEPDIHLMDTAAQLLTWLERELEEPLWTKEILAQYPSLKSLSNEALTRVIESNWFKVDKGKNLEVSGFERELNNWNKNPEELLSRSIALKSFLLHEILILATLVRNQSHILSLKQITTLVEQTSRMHLHMVSPQERWEYEKLKSDRSGQYTALVTTSAQHTQQTLTWWATEQWAWATWWITKRQPSIPPIQVPERHEVFFEKEKSLIEFLVLSFIFKSKDLLISIMHGYTQNPILFDQHRPFTVYKSLDTWGKAQRE